MSLVAEHLSADGFAVLNEAIRATGDPETLVAAEGRIAAPRNITRRLTEFRGVHRDKRDGRCVAARGRPPSAPWRGR